MAIAHQSRVLMVMTAQVVLSAVFISGYFYTLNQFMTGEAKVPVEYKEVVITLLGVLTTVVVLIANYWFQRQREQTPQGEGK